MDDNIQDLFIVKEDVGQKRAEELARRAIKFGRITQEGTVVMDKSSLSKGDQLKLILVIRYIGNSLNESIPRHVRPSELTTVLGQRLEAVGATLSRLASEGFAKKEGHGEYSVFPYKIDSFLSDLEGREAVGTDSSTTTYRKKTTRKGSSQLRGGIGSHIQQLIDDGFFAKPKTISELVEKLKEENVHRDVRVIDKTLRETFVSNRRILTRVKKTGPGRSTWTYVLRNPV